MLPCFVRICQSKRTRVREWKRKTSKLDKDIRDKTSATLNRRKFTGLSPRKNNGESLLSKMSVKRPGRGFLLYTVEGEIPWRREAIAGLHLTSRQPYWRSKTKAFLSSGNLTLFSSKFFKKVFCCIDLQHGRLVTWLQTKNLRGLLDTFFLKGVKRLHQSFNLAAQSLIQPFMEPFELNFNQKEPFKKPILAHAGTYFNPWVQISPR